MRIRKLIDRVKVAGKRPKPGAPARRDEADLALEQLRNVPVPRLPRPPEEVARLIEGERARWGRTVSPEESELMAALTRVGGGPQPANFGSADLYVDAYRSWLRGERSAPSRGAGDRAMRGPSNLIGRVRALASGPRIAERRLRYALTSDEKRFRLAETLHKLCGADAAGAREFVTTGGLVILSDPEHWRRWGVYAKARGDTQRVSIFAELAKTADAVAERRSWREDLARGCEVEGDHDRAARLRAMDAAERADQEPKRAAARAALPVPDFA